MDLIPYIISSLIGAMAQFGTVERLHGSVKSITELYTADSSPKTITKTIYLYDKNGLLICQKDSAWSESIWSGTKEIDRGPSSSSPTHYDYSYSDGLLTRFKITTFGDENNEDQVQLIDYKYDHKKRCTSRLFYSAQVDTADFFDSSITIYDDNDATSTTTQTIKHSIFYEAETYYQKAYYSDDRLSKEWRCAGKDTVWEYYTYNNQGKIIQINSTHSSGNSTFTFDEFGRVKEKLFYYGSEKSLIKYTYSNFDDKGNYQRMEATDSTIVTREIEYY